MDGCSSASDLWYQRFKPLGKVRRRIQDLRIPSASYFLTSSSRLDLSHNESMRLAVDCLLSRGLEGYHEVLKAEGEVDFLSELEKDYILKHREDAVGESDDVDRESDGQSCFGCSEVTAENGSKEESLDQNSEEDVKPAGQIPDDPRVEVFFQSDHRAAGMKDLVRQFIRKAKLALAVVTDNFSDPELLCDLLEASRKRNVSVYLLLDHLNLKVFVSMWEDLKLSSRHFPMLLVQSVHGLTYCAKTGRKLKGRIAESFIIADWTEVLSGSYSLTWLSWQVHQSLAVLIRGRSVSRFHQEFYRLYSDSEPVPDFVSFMPVLPSLCPYTTSQEAQSVRTEPRAWTEDREDTRTTPAEKLLGGSEDSKQPVLGAAAGSHSQRTKSQHSVVYSPPEAGANTELLERNQTQTHEDSYLPDQTSFSDAKAHPDRSVFSSIPEQSLKVQEQASSPRHGQLRAVCYQSHLKKVISLDHTDVGTEGFYSQQNISEKPLVFTSVRNTQRYLWNCSPISDNPEFISSPQQAPGNLILQFPFTSTKGRVFRLHTESSRLHQHQALIHSHFNASCSQSTAKTSPLRPQPHTHPRHILSDVRAQLLLQPVVAQQINTTLRLNWTPQRYQAAGTRAVSRHNSFSGTDVVEQLDWRSPQSGMKTSLGRSMSMMERRPGCFRGLL
ncbi:protein FAM83A-like [Nothobranchius furzeri]|uniref:Family with sequence similarity 83, member A n=2 Tax=Nothobranchius TaxID=28779 RepID=A0A1A8B7Z4_NOTFU|nr:transcript variant X2 [Nothobranchius furzeri]